MSFRARLSSLVCLALAAAAAPAPGQRWLDAPLVFAPGGPGEEAIAVGDLDLDGDPDVVFADDLGNLVVRRNDGASGFTSDAPIPLPSGVILGRDFWFFSQDDPRIGDFDGDGDLDLAFCADVGVTILPGDGAGSFQAPVSVPLPFPATRLAVGDFDADGVAELAVTYAVLPVQLVWIDHAGGAYQVTPPAFLSVGYQNAVSLATGDFDQDGFDDAVATLEMSGDYELVHTVNGQPVYTGAFPNNPFVTATLYVWAGDLDGDGDDDMLLGGLMNDEFTLQPYWNVNGALRFGTPAQTSAPGLNASIGVRRMELVDWDEDGDLDLAGQTYLTSPFDADIAAWFVEQVDHPTFPGTWFPDPRPVPVPDAGAMAGVADLDGDGHVDFCGARSVVFGDGTFDLPLQPALDGDPAGAHLADLDDDADVDVVDGAFLRTNDAAGAFAGTADWLPDPGANLAYAGPIVVADLTGDGRLDALVERRVTVGDLFADMRVLAGQPDGSFLDVGAAALAPIGGPGTRAGDFDGDGDVDVFTPTGLWRNDGATHLVLGPTFAHSSIEDAADFDGDGDLDVLARNGDQLVLLRRDPGGYSSQVLFTQIGLASSAAWLDVDDDGDLDVVAPAVTFGVPRVYVIEHLPGPTFASMPGLEPFGVAAERFAAIDLDGDGLSDLVGASEAYDEAPASNLDPYGGIVAFRRSGPGLVFEPARRWIGHRNAGFADADQDGDLDVVGRTVVRSTRFASPAQGTIRQYGAGTAGTGGAVPLLGARGPATTSSTTFELRLRDALGGAPSLLVLGLAEGAIADVPYPGMTQLVGGAPFLAFLPIGGTPGAAGEGALTLPVALPAPYAGQTVFLQTWHVDPAAPFWLTQSNGLELHFGT